MLTFLERLFLSAELALFLRKRVIAAIGLIFTVYFCAIVSLSLKLYWNSDQKALRTEDSFLKNTHIVTLPDPLHFSKKIMNQPGSDLETVLTNNRIISEDKHSLKKALKRVITPQDLRLGRDFKITYTPKEHGDHAQLNTFTMRITFDKEIYAQRKENGDYLVTKINNPLAVGYKIIQGTIDHSFYQDARKKGTNNRLLHQIIRALGHKFDLQRDLHKGDTFRLLFKKITNLKTKESQQKECLFVELISKRKISRIYHYQHPKHPGIDFFDEKGCGLKSYFLKTPVDGARLSSGFGYRSHPILGYTKLHQGVDFSAAAGTPVMAAGDGIILQAAYKGSYGNYVLIGHAGGYATAYAHLRNYRQGLRVGMRVKQGNVIGYVGATGRATGPHLHFELIKNGKRINPKSVRMLPTVKLLGKDYTHFQTYITKLLAIKEG